MPDEKKPENSTREYTVEPKEGETYEMKTEIRTDEPGTLAPSPAMPSDMPSSDEPTTQFEEISDKVSQLLADLPAYVSDFFKEYKRPLITVGLLVGAVIAVKLTFAMLDALDDIPLLAPAFELIGFGYSIWFVYRYLLKASNRQELSDDFNNLKEQVLGGSRVK
jgi:hypothetical protein